MTLTEEEEISRWDELLKDRYTENDLFYTEHLAKIRKGPPVIEQWSRSRGRAGWSNDRRCNRRRDGIDRGGGGGDRRDERWGRRLDRRWRDDDRDRHGCSSRREFQADDRGQLDRRDSSRERIEYRSSQRQIDFDRSLKRRQPESQPDGNKNARTADGGRATVTRNERGWEVEEI